VKVINLGEGHKRLSCLCGSERRKEMLSRRHEGAKAPKGSQNALKHGFTSKKQNNTAYGI
jgi:hypothetical protein